MKLLKVPTKIYEKYKDTVYGNENITLDQCRRKLTRNVMLAKEITIRNRLDRLLGKRLYFYGNLDIMTQFGRVIHIHNHQGGRRKFNWVLDETKYIELTKKLEIEPNKY